MRHRHRHVAVCASLLMIACGAQAGQDLLADWRAAAAHDPTYAAARAGRDAGLSKSDQAKALWRPTVLAGANLGWASQKTSTSGASFEAPGFGTSSDVAFKTNVDSGRAQGWSLMLQQPLINADRTASSSQLDLQAQLADVQWHQSQQELILRVSKAHFDVLAARVALRANRPPPSEHWVRRKSVSKQVAFRSLQSTTPRPGTTWWQLRSLRHKTR
jgi:outer membrane protein